MKKMFGLLILSLSFSGLFAYTSEITVFGKEDKRFILIGGAHTDYKKYSDAQDAFFEKFIDALKAHKPDVTKFYYELDSSEDKARKQYIVEKGTDKLRFYSPFKALTTTVDPALQAQYKAYIDWDGTALARLRYYDPTINFTTESFDVRTDVEEQEERIIYQALKDSILLSLTGNPEKHKQYEEFFGSMSSRRVRVHAGDLQLIEQIKSEFSKYSIFLYHAGFEHTRVMKELLEIEGWIILTETKSCDPAEWTPLMEIFTEEPVDVVEAQEGDWQFMDAGDAFNPKLPEATD